MWAFMLIVTLTIWGYAVARGLWLLPLSRRWRLGIALLLLPLAEYHSILKLLNPPPGYPEQPRVLLIALAFGFGSLLLLALLALLRDLLMLPLSRVSKPWARCLTRPFPTLMLILGATALSGLGVHQALAVPEVKRVEIHVTGLPPAFDGYRLVQLSDLHISRLFTRAWLAAVVARTQAQHPSLIVITGDLQDGTPLQLAADMQPLTHLHAPDGVIVVPGNHEYYYNYSLWMRTFRQLGLITLENQHLLLERAQEKLLLAGLTDPQATRFHLPAPDLAQALKTAPHGVPVLLLTHQPKNVRDYAKAGVTLQLAGHTHGGQMEGLHLLTQWANRGFVAGLYQVDGMPLYVSSGTALWAGLPLRLGRPSEITLMTLRARQ